MMRLMMMVLIIDRKKFRQARERWKASEDGGCIEKKEESQRVGKQGVLINHLRLLIDIWYVDFKSIMDETHLIVSQLKFLTRVTWLQTVLPPGLTPTSTNRSSQTTIFNSSTFSQYRAAWSRSVFHTMNSWDCRLWAFPYCSSFKGPNDLHTNWAGRRIQANLPPSKKHKNSHLFIQLSILMAAKPIFRVSRSLDNSESKDADGPHTAIRLLVV